jgi:hypothetical protein
MSRLISAIVLVIALFNVFGLWSRRFRAVLAVIFFLTTVVYLAGVLLYPKWNPYEIVAMDNSGFARLIAYGALNSRVAEHLFFGIGIASNRDDFTEFVGEPYAFWEDLGPFGVWATFGVIGIIVFLCLVEMCILDVKRDADVAKIKWDALSLTALSFGLLAILTPDLWGGSSTVFTNVVLATWLRERSRRPQAIVCDDLQRVSQRVPEAG